MGMLIRRHREGIDAARQAEVEPTIDPEPEVPAQPVEPPTGDEAVAEGTPGGAEEIEDKTGHFEGQTVSEVKEEATEAAPEAKEVPTRNASKATWLEYLGLDSDERSRDELADSVLGPKQ